MDCSNPRPRYARIARHVLAAFVPVLLMLAAAAVRAEPTRNPVDENRWRAECGSCHIAFPPSLMTAAAWRQVMASLDRHYGTDASLDAATVTAIAAFLERNAGSGKRAARLQSAPPGVGTDRAAAKEVLPRITTSPWFLREHREISNATLRRHDVGGFANCAACHTRADAGDYGERSIRVPR